MNVENHEKRRGRPRKSAEEKKMQFSVYLSDDVRSRLAMIDSNLSRAIELITYSANR